MKLRAWFGVGALALAGGASAQFSEVVPNANAGTAGNGTFLYMVTTGRSYQLLIHQDQLAGLVGKSLNGLQFRLPTSSTSTWPPADATFANFDIYIGQGVDPAARSLTFANNFVGSPTQVRSGSLTFGAGSFPTTGTPRDWGPTIGFNNFAYSGGHLTVEMRHSGMTGTTTTRSWDANTTSAAGYGTQYSALWTGSYTPVTGSAGNFFITRITAVPEPATLLALGAGVALLARRRRK